MEAGPTEPGPTEPGPTEPGVIEPGTGDGGRVGLRAQASANCGWCSGRLAINTTRTREPYITPSISPALSVEVADEAVDDFE